MHITTSIESFETFTILILAVSQHKNKTQRKNTRYKEKNTFLNDQLIFADDNYLRNFFVINQFFLLNILHSINS